MLCPKCKSRRWFREAKKHGGKRPTFWRTIAPGQTILYKWPASKEGRAALSKSLYYYQGKYNGLSLSVVPEGILVRYRVPALNI